MVAGWLPDEVFGRDSQHIEPFAYLRDLFTRISTHPHNQLDELLPDRWQPQNQPPSPDLPLVPGDMPAVGSYGFAGRVRIDELELWVRYRQFCNIVLGL